MRVPADVVDRVLDEVRPTLPAGIRVSRVGLHGVSIETDDHRVFGFLQSPWPLPPGPKKARIKSALVDFIGSLRDAVGKSLGREWPGPRCVTSVVVSRERASIRLTSDGENVSVDLPLALWRRA